MSRFINTMLATAGLVLVALLPVQSTRADTPRAVKNAILQLLTDGDGKDDTDVFTVTVANAGGKVLERVYDAKEEIKPFTTFNLWLTRVRAVPPEQINGSKITFRIDTKWDEHWVVKDARLTVNYDTGPPDKWHWGPFVLQVKGANPMWLDFPLSDDHRL